MNTCISEYDWNGFSYEGFLNQVTKRYPAPEPQEGKLAVESVEQLYAVCRSNDPGSELLATITAKQQFMIAESW